MRAFRCVCICNNHVHARTTETYGLTLKVLAHFKCAHYKWQTRDAHVFRVNMCRNSKNRIKISSIFMHFALFNHGCVIGVIKKLILFFVLLYLLFFWLRIIFVLEPNTYNEVLILFVWFYEYTIMYICMSIICCRSNVNMWVDCFFFSIHVY